MALVDERGRVFGRVNLIDFAVGVFVLLLVPLAYGAWVLFRPATPVLTSVQPSHFLAGTEEHVHLTGTGFRPFVSATIGANRAQVLLVESPSSAEIVVPDSVPPGTYDLTLYDESLELVRFPGAITVDAPPPPPEASIVVRVSGSFRTVPQAAAAALKPGAKFPAGSASPTAEIVSLGPALPEVVNVASAYGVLQQEVTGYVRAPAELKMRCIASGGPCKVGAVTVGTGAVLTVPGAPGPFEVFDVGIDNKTPASDNGPRFQNAEIAVRAATSPEAVALLKAGASDADRRLFALDSPAPPATLLTFRKEFDFNGTASVDWAGPDVTGGATPIMGVPRPLTMLSATLKVPIQRTPRGWQYKGSAVKIGAPFFFEGPFYTFRGWIVSVKVGRD